MARNIERLTALSVSRAKQAGYLADGGGLYLQVSRSGAKSWVFRYRNRHDPEKKKGVPCEMGLGPVHTVGLAKARELAKEKRTFLLSGVDPINQRKAGRLEAELDAARAMTFKQCAVAYIAAHQASWKNE